jgi:hypothetical protein
MFRKAQERRHYRQAARFSQVWRCGTDWTLSVGPGLLRHIWNPIFGSPLFLASSSLSANGEFHFPIGIAIDRAGADVILVTDHYNHRVPKFDREGKLLGLFPVLPGVGGNSWCDHPPGTRCGISINREVAGNGPRPTRHSRSGGPRGRCKRTSRPQSRLWLRAGTLSSPVLAQFFPLCLAFLFELLSFGFRLLPLTFLALIHSVIVGLICHRCTSPRVRHGSRANRLHECSNESRDYIEGRETAESNSAVRLAIAGHEFSGTIRGA